MGTAFWLRWSWRGLRRQLSQVVAIAAIIALGSAIYAGLGSTSVWRRLSLNATFAQLHAHDIEVTTTPGTALPEQRLLAVARRAGGPALSAVEARLVVDLPVRAGRGGAIPAAGTIVGVNLARGVDIDRWQVSAGRDIGLRDANGSAVLLDQHFAAEHALAPQGRMSIAGHGVSYTGTALEPEYLNVNAVVGATIQGAATRAVVYAPITLAQRLAGLPGAANDVIATVRAGADVERVAARMRDALGRLEPEIALSVTVRRDDQAVRALYDEIDSEQRIFDVFALLVLAGAGFAAFNLTRRSVEAQRRDIGIAMALGLPRRQIAIRPLLLAIEVALAGVALGALGGWAIGGWVLAIIRTREPLPVWETPWQWGLFLVAAALGLAIPLCGSAYPTWRAVRVVPTDALLPPHLRTTRHRLSALTRRIALRGSTAARAPLRRITIAPLRSAMTALAMALILAPLLAAFGTTDSMDVTIDTGTRILAGASGDRLLVTLRSAQPADGPVVTAITGSKLVRESALGLDTGGYLIKGRTTIAASIAMVDLANPLVVPADLAGRALEPGGIVISKKAASDLDVRSGDRLILRHPQRVGTGVRLVDSAVPVRAVITSPYRFVAYMDLRDETLMGVAGVVNTATLVARRGVTIGELQRSVASLPGVASALAASSLSGTIANVLALVANLFVILQVVVGLMAFLVAYNSSKIGSDERARQNATMMAFGIGTARIVLIGVIESLLLGLAGLAVGLGLGLVLVRVIVGSVIPAAVPELATLESVAPWSLLLTALIALAAAVFAPIFTLRRLRTMSLPSTLRYVE